MAHLAPEYWPIFWPELTVNDYNAHLSVKDELDHVVRVCRETGRTAAVIVSSSGELLSRVQDGYRLICAGADLNVAEEGWRAMRETLSGRSSSAQP